MILSIWGRERDYNTADFDKHLCRKIIEYLMGRIDHKDELNGILLGVYEEEIGRLTKDTLKTLGYLISQGIIHEEKYGEGTTWYKISESLDIHSEKLKKFEL